MADIPCPVCSEVLQGERCCSSCEGAGYHDDEGYKFGCRPCLGRGFVTCSTCDGSGYLDEGSELAALMAERDPALTLLEMGFEPIEAA